MTLTLACSWSKHKAVLTCKPELSWTDSDSRQLHCQMLTGSRSIRCWHHRKPLTNLRLLDSWTSKILSFIRWKKHCHMLQKRFHMCCSSDWLFHFLNAVWMGSLRTWKQKLQVQTLPPNSCSVKAQPYGCSSSSSSQSLASAERLRIIL